jgi:diguanylate cyclase (GGDEF)-like protein
VQEDSQQSSSIRQGLNLLSDPDIRPALVDSAQAQDPSVSGNTRVNGAAGVVLVQPMFGFDETGEGIAGWVVAGVAADRLIRDSATFLPRGADVRVVMKEDTLYGPSGAADPEEVVTLAVGRSKWQISATGVGNGFSLLAPWLVLVVGLALTTLVTVLFRQAARLDQARRKELERLAQAALVDSLTGLRNHRAFQEDLTRELNRQNRSGSPLSLVMLDIEGLKAVNDTLGHQEGDERLKSLAESLRSAARGSDALYRLGGDEFALLLPETNAWGSFQFVQRLQADLVASPGDGRVAVAAGVADTIGLEMR